MLKPYFEEADGLGNTVISNQKFPNEIPIGIAMTMATVKASDFFLYHLSFDENR